MRYAKRTFILLTALLIWVTLGYQFHLFMVWAENHHFGILGGLWSFFSFFTNLSNMLAGLILLYASFKPERALFQRNASLFTATLLYLCMAGIVYNLELSHTVPGNSLTYLVNVTLHDTIPALFMVFWIFCVPHGNHEIKHVFWWLVFPFAYFGQVMLRGWLIGQYPYAFFNVKLLGYQEVLINGLMMMTGFVLAGGLFVAVDRLKRRY